MGERLNQHYVPQFYFRNFATLRNRIGMLLVENGQIVPNAPIRGQCSRKNFYGSKKIESDLSLVESQHCTAIRAALEIAHVAEAQDFSLEELLSLYDAVALQRGRTAIEIDKHGPALEAMQLDLFRHYLECEYDEEFLRKFDEARDKGQISVTQTDSQAIGNQLMVMLENSPLLRDLQYCLISNKTDYPFIFSDSPVVFYNTYAKHVRNRGVLGLQCPGLQVFYPLDSRTCLMLFDRDRYSGPCLDYLRFDAYLRSDVSQINALQLHHSLNAVYFGDVNDRDYVYELWKAHRLKLSALRSEYRVALDLIVDGKPPEGELSMFMEPQINHDLNLSFIDCDPVPESDYVYTPRSPELHASVTDEWKDDE